MSRLINLDLDLVRAFVTVSEARSFTRAGERLGRSQSAVSLQMRRLEERLGVQLLSRDPRHVVLTPEGEAFLPQARRLLRVNDEIVADLRGDDLEGEVRLGAPEDFATVHLPEILGQFARAHPRVALSVTCDLTLNLLERLRDGALDVALVKREPLGPDLGVRVWREPLVWAAADAAVLKSAEPAPLVVAPAPCVYRKRAVAALEAQGMSWRAAYTSPSLAGQHAALRAGLGLTVLPRDMIPPDLKVLGEAEGLPHLEDAEIALLKSRTAVPLAADRLAEFILSSLDRRHALVDVG
ncbi:MAG: LysR family transcriptional regulator [Phenylobacterium sp.]|uniref:LysR substrate-binding domain-containing protein n=1 Tax=Phenylobacterium sp. TaxID=1871053 RepID=UPI001B41CEC8|nr:LysR substrate-binding domain-containing protein [Phenylobacterium sp.]MBP7650326.1 LysR family transcriptional regulator [Phenylobacterium sp.]MBP7817693.1 LysR family transcriptional regulator [Phenylobacterium sp.]MBP9230550.1 LysR family transcriptional regulator [Phenylobacterium sp.]MBP9756130.1 LysR family transcriptional regulator [Phenylobacterium sp.]